MTNFTSGHLGDASPLFNTEIMQIVLLELADFLNVQFAFQNKE